MAAPKAPVEDRFWTKVRESDAGCWEWLGKRNPQGYGGIKVEGRWLPAHRVAYELVIGVIRPGLVIDHLCRNPRCVNPAHLEPVTSRENALRGLNGRLRTHCVRGHAFDRTYGHGRGRHQGRYCSTCRREASRRAWERKKAARSAATNL